MISRRIALLVAWLTLMYVAAPLLAGTEGPEICCSGLGECPDDLQCLASSSCDQSSPGYCVPVEVGGR